MAAFDRRPGVRPRLTLGRRLDSIARASFPACLTVLLMLLVEAPLGIGNKAVLLPAIAISCVWFWSFAQPDHLPPPVVFLIGLLLDLLGYLPLGVGVLTLLAVLAVASPARRLLAGRGFVCCWCAFALVASAASLLIWLLVMLLTMHLLSPRPAVFQAVLSMAIYPLLAGPLGAARRSITEAEPD